MIILALLLGATLFVARRRQWKWAHLKEAVKRRAEPIMTSVKAITPLAAADGTAQTVELQGAPGNYQPPPVSPTPVEPSVPSPLHEEPAEPADGGAGVFGDRV